MRLGLVGLLGACGAVAQVTSDNVMTTFAAAWSFPGGLAGRNAPIGTIVVAHLDNAGNVIFTDPGSDVVCRIDSGPARSASLFDKR